MERVLGLFLLQEMIMEHDFQVMLDSFRKVTTSSISDAIDSILCRRGYMSHTIKPLVDAKMVGPAATVLTAPSNQRASPRMALELIDSLQAGTVIVISVSGEREEVAAWGGIMTTGAQVRGLAGAVMDGAARDAKEIRDLGFPVFAAGTVPATSVGRFVNVACQAPIVCGGVQVEPGDIIVGDADGVVVVPRARAKEILQLAQQLEEAELETEQQIRAQGSILKAMAELGRI